MAGTSSPPLLFSKGPFSNFYSAPIVLTVPGTKQTEYRFPDNETYFQCYKVWVVTSLVDGNFDGELFRAVLKAGTPMQAKRMAGWQNLVMRGGAKHLWNNYYAPVAMLQCNLAKYHQHSNLRDRLARTGTRPLVEHRPDPIWGDNMDGTGKNLLGKTLEIVRAVVCR